MIDSTKDVRCKMCALPLSEAGASGSVDGVCQCGQRVSAQNGGESSKRSPFQVRHRATGEVLLEMESQTVRQKDFRGMDFSAGDFSYFNLSQTSFKAATLKECVFIGCKNSHPNTFVRWLDWGVGLLEGTSISTNDWTDFVEATLDGATFWMARLVNMNANGARCEKASFTNAYMPHCTFEGALLNSAEFTETYAPKSSFSRAQMVEFNGRESVLTESTFRSANLSKSSFVRCKLIECSFENADLSGCDLSQANLTRADLSGVNLEDAHLAGAVLTEVKFDRNTRWPIGFSFPVPSNG